MAEYDGSIRIGVKVDAEGAKKQLENLKKRQLEQVKAINEQVKSIQKLEEQYKRLTDASVEPKGIEKLERDLKKAQEEAAKLDAEFQRLEQIGRMDMSATGKVSPETASRLMEISYQLEKADTRVDSLNQQLKKLRMPPETSEEAKRLAEQITQAKERLGQLQDESGKTASAITKLQSWPSQLGIRIAEISSKIKGFFTKSVNNAARSTKNLHDNMRKVGSNRGFTKASKSADGFLDKLGRIINRIKRIAVSALVFNVFRRAFSELSKQISSYLTVNKQFTDSLSTIKGNLLTAFQPIYETIIPALNELMGILQEASAILAKFMSTLFGTTPKKAQDNAKALKEQAEATEELAGETKKAEKAFASFDTVEVLGNKKEESKAAGKTEAAFDQDFEDVQVPKWLDVLGDKLKEIMGWLKDFFKPLKDSWDKYGPAVMDALKSALSSIWKLIEAIVNTFLKLWQSPIAQETLWLIYSILETIFGIIGDIADTFRKVWENGAGERILTNIFTLLNIILAIIDSIAQAFRNAWSNYGEQVVEALYYALNSILELLISIGQAFLEAWNDGGRGQQIFETILQIVRNIFNIVGELANRLKEAWEANDNGKRIWAAILDSIQKVLDFIHNVTEATLEWAENLNLEPIVSAFAKVMESLPPLLETIGQALYEIYTEIVLPFLTKLIEQWIPWILEKLATLFDWLSKHKDVVKVLIEVVASFIAAWKLVTVIQAIGAVVNALDPMKLAITAILAVIILIIANFDKLKEIAENVVKAIVDWFKEAAQAVKEFWDSLLGNIKQANAGFTGGGYGGFGGVMPYSDTGVSAFSMERFADFNAAYNVDNLPHLANGAVISPNSEYLAVLGDQRAGKNIESPLSTIEQALDNVMSRRGGDGNTTVEVNFTGSLSQLARVLRPEIRIAEQQKGSSLVSFGGMSSG